MTPSGPAPGRYRLSAPVGIGSLLVGLVSAGLRVGLVDGALMGDRDAVCGWFARALDFPDWFGRNWDALLDSLADLSWLGEREVAVLWRRFDAMPTAVAATAAAVVDAAIERRVEIGLPALYVLLPPAGGPDPAGTGGLRAANGRVAPGTVSWPRVSGAAPWFLIPA